MRTPKGYRIHKQDFVESIGWTFESPAGHFSDDAYALRKWAVAAANEHAAGTFTGELVDKDGELIEEGG